MGCDGEKTGFEAIGSGRKPDLAYNQLRRMLESEVLKPGELPSEPDPAGRFGASRTALREALKVLELSGYLESEGGTGPLSPRHRPRSQAGVSFPAVTQRQPHETAWLSPSRTRRGWRHGRVSGTSRRALEEDFGCKVYDCMGTADVCLTVWSECEEQDGMHLLGGGSVSPEIIGGEIARPIEHIGEARGRRRRAPDPLNSNRLDLQWPRRRLPVAVRTRRLAAARERGLRPLREGLAGRCCHGRHRRERRRILRGRARTARRGSTGRRTT
ncbi:MAG: hypothetical protein AVDCRST_MAG25-1431 [uncultured Rubrobacteraceae bacterium]|uniref:HTH gntR-type domain-containing protein n=1 Tax=uncultured Rubrobacteraceae bacterium TaxID=349277 RepID=A0A6J4R5Z7_9ACTN|nr:MAG: hypothetical protein AVDCRST_MAG25-1431 [uncultured Rubrobacteraceae bacterium]